jgi:hypothetical protein
MGRRVLDLMGRRIGFLVVLERVGEAVPVVWRCQCDCGAECLRYGATFRTARFASCGCYRTGWVNRRHGMTRTPTYRSWLSMRSRCLNPRNARFKTHGARGITVCDRWRVSFEAFLADMGERPGLEYSLDRIDNDGPYSPENCRWATPCEQQRNRRSNRRITFQGRTATLAEWGELTGIRAATIATRLRRLRWPVAAALTQASAPRRCWRGRAHRGAEQLCLFQMEAA